MTSNTSQINFNETFFVLSIIISLVITLYIVCDCIFNMKSRGFPALLMVIRTVCNFFAVMIILITIRLPNKIPSENGTECQIQGAIFLFVLYMSAVYYARIYWELYLTLKNPFHASYSSSISFHLLTIFVCGIIAFLVGIFQQFAFRHSFQICFMKKSSETVSKLNIVNWIVIYIPLFIICVSGIIATILVAIRLKAQINYNTAELRERAIKQQIAIVISYTINYGFQGICWFLLFTNTFPNHHPYILSTFCLIALIFDVIAWILRKYSKYIQLPRVISSTSYIINNNNNNNNNNNIKNISDALRKDVITCIITGLSKGNPNNIKHREESELQPMNGK
eukprot:216756_1